MQEFLIGRQPIFDRRQRTIGYELLYRPYSDKPMDADSWDQATNQVILNYFFDVGMDELVGTRKAFINVTFKFLTGKLPTFLPNKVVLEVTEDINYNDWKLTESLKSLAKRGFWIALDDVTSLNKVKPLLDIVKIIKIDLPYVKKSVLPQMVEQFKKYPVKVLAEKVETQEQFEYCRSIGCDYFQGYFFCAPIPSPGIQIDSSRMVILHSLAKLQDPDVNFHDLENIINRDVTLSYKLLRLVNSAYYSRLTVIKSISEAVAVIGLQPLSGWLALLLIASVNNKPHELTTIAILRAKLCELLARLQGKKRTEIYFMVGLFSVLDALLDHTMKEIVDSIPVSQEVRNALLERKGPAGEILEMVIAIDHGDWDRVLKPGLPIKDILKVYTEAVGWTSNQIKLLEKAL